MQYRMQTHPLAKDQMESLLHKAQTGCLATLNADNTPYVTPVHFLYQDGIVYIHGLPKGQKISNLTNRSSVCMTVYEMEALLLDPENKPCDTNTNYQSVILSGKATLLHDEEEKQNVLCGIVNKYTPHLQGVPLPPNMVRGTAVIRIDILEMTGKYYI
ncbi:hypothetical protein SDC9_179505 [bioreactor metagenome]|uniref:Pyridoxamine 5'-phosphate oxidase putative domain-containing protein n=1 Tax=bioreactor metagenome TaxID=1076179 RepID=A0A645H212_9ZZZZ|nr:pyridoxamine 5'-phosphate oxidase family protein [Candidatus Pelethousia sp.]NCB30211.1 pyridoxamine 5'-phosphate oxidase family protein [Clostridia bacterium]